MQKDLTILSLNIWHGSLQAELLAYIKQKMDTVDVFCFQEADGPAFPALEALLRQDYCAYYADKVWGVEHFRVATYVRRQLVVTASKPVLKDVEGSGLALTCTISIDDDTYFSVTSVHGQPRPGDKLDDPIRIAQSQAILKSTMANGGINIIVGDFNLLPNTLSIDMFAQNGYKNLIDEFNIPTTRNEIAWRKYPNNKQLYADYVFIKSDDSLRYDFAVENIDVSDHLPLLLSLDVKVLSTSPLTRDLSVLS